MLGREQHAGLNGALVGPLQVSWVAGDGVASEVLAEGRVPESEVAGGAAVGHAHRCGGKDNITAVFMRPPSDAVAHDEQSEPLIDEDRIPRQPNLEQKSCHRSETRDNFSDDL